MPATTRQQPRARTLPGTGPLGRVPGYDDSDFDWLAFDQSGVVSTRQAVSSLGEGTIRGLIRSGRWRSICRGVVLASSGRLTRDQQLWVAVLAAGSGAVLAGTAAAAESGVRGLRREPLHVLVPGTTTLRRLPLDMPAVLVHRTVLLPESHLQVGPPDAYDDRSGAGRRGSVGAWRRRGENAASRGLPAAARDPAGNPGCRRCAAEAAAAIANPAYVGRRRGRGQALSELDFVRLCRRYGPPAPDLQEKRTDAAGHARYLDAYWRRWRLHVEVDGAHHMDVRHWAADMRRQNEVWIAGDRILRFPALLVRARPAEVATQLRAALEAAGWGWAVIVGGFPSAANVKSPRITAVAQLWTNTATLRAGTVNVPLAASNDAVRSTGSADSRSAGCRETSAPRSPATVWVAADWPALNITVMERHRGSRPAPSSRMVISPPGPPPRRTPHLLEAGGHIGYDVRPTARRRGHATSILRAALPIAHGLGIDPALVTCDTDNIASRRVIECNGGVLEDQRGGKLRFWVPTPAQRSRS